jgi:hypothetical protein
VSKGPNALLEEVLIHDIVVTKQSYELARRKTCRTGEVGCIADVVGMGDDANTWIAERPDEVDGRIRRCIVADHKLEIVVGLSQDGCDRVRKEVDPVVDGNHDTDQRSRCLHADSLA